MGGWSEEKEEEDRLGGRGGLINPHNLGRSASSDTCTSFRKDPTSWSSTLTCPRHSDILHLLSSLIMPPGPLMCAPKLYTAPARWL